MAGHIPTYLDRIEQRPMADIGGSTPRVNVNAYGRNGNAGLLVRGGNDLLRLGGELSQFAIERQEREIATDLLADKVAYEDAMRQFESSYKETHKGEDARTAEEDFNEFHKKRQEELDTKWQGNPYALRASAYMAANLRSPSMNRATAYRDIEDQEHLKSTLKASRIQALQKFSDPNTSNSDKLKALEGEEINLRTFAGQRLQTVNGQKQWVGGRNVDPELLQLQEQFKQGEKKIVQDQLVRLYLDNPAAGLDMVDAALYGAGVPSLPEDATALATAEAERQGVSPGLVLAVMARESNGKVDAISPAGARGLMQLMPETAKDLGVNPDNAQENVRGGVQYLKQMLDRYDGNQELALMAYNWGPGNVDAYLKTGKGKNGQEVPGETQKYVPSVLGMAGQTGSNGEAFGLRRMFSAEELVAQRSAFERAIAARGKAQEEAFKEQRASVEKDIYAKAYDKKLTRVDVEAARDTLTPDDYFKALKLIEGETSLPDKSDPEALIAMQRMAVTGDPAMQDTADDFLRAGRLTNGDYSKMLNEAQQWRKPVIRQADEVLRLKTGYSEMNPNPDAGSSYLMARDDFQTWLDSEEGHKASDDEKLRMANRVGDNYRIAQAESILAVPVPLFIVGSRTMPDIKATIAATNKARADGRLTETEYAEQARRIKRMADILERQTQETSSTKENRR